MASQLTKEFLRKGNQCEKKPCYEKKIVDGARTDLHDNSDIEDEKSEYRRFLNGKAELVGIKQLSPNEISWPGTGSRAQGSMYRSTNRSVKVLDSMTMEGQCKYC